MAEHEVKRIDRRLETLESCLSSLRMNPDVMIEMITGRPDAERVAAVEAEIALQNARLRELLAE